MKLGNRLMAVANFVEKNCVIADIGTDHAYLPIYLVEEKIVARAFACDVHTGPYQAAKQAVKNYLLEDKIEVRLGDGIRVLKPNEATFLTIAGMGGTTMVEILSAKPEVLAGVKGMALQPQNATSSLRNWLWNNGWRIEDEDLVIDEGRLYEIILAKPGQDAWRDESLSDIGTILWKKRHPLLKNHIQNLLMQSKRILMAMEKSEDVKQSEKYKIERNKVKGLEERLKCL
ncbi:tRNA (adenine(22)-N(1))-methyltransferase [Anaerosinus gibii]|uniref:Class I SAM-dependent methyltransferase n=1 Tax=Selenobaculum gibii TaxID=3054208 RepID=A0A9Y2AJX5_9FIRM|nr:class I SAM-dependent methyltransferase [Selenobaculum gbiensis]WIW71438.1 class I SAM-dependent methyltransferase [Selenobaculum gbiensis]